MTEKKKLVIATDNFLPRWDGIARFLTEVVSRLKSKYEIIILTSKFDGRYDDTDIKIIRFPLRSFYIGDFPPAIPKNSIIKKILKDADIVWVQTIGPIGSRTINLASKLKKRLICYNHSIEWELVPSAIGQYILKKPAHILAKWFAKKQYNKCDVLYVPTNEVGEKLKRIGITTRTVTIPLGVDSETFFPPGRKNKAKLAIRIDPKHFVVGYVGRIAREKDIRTLLRAFLRVRKHDSSTRLLIVGDGVESLKNLLASKEGIILVGSKDNVIPYLHAMDAYVLPSLTETTSLSTLEAMSCGLPVIATRVGLIKEYVKNKVNGFLVNKGDAFSIYKHIVELKKDPLLSQKIGRKARETVVNEFSWDNTAKKIEEELEKLLENEKNKSDTTKEQKS